MAYYYKRHGCSIQRGKVGRWCLSEGPDAPNLLREGSGLMTQDMKVAVAEELVEADAGATQLSSVATRTIFAASPARVWRGLVFYEELGSRPPLLLRLLLPVPIRTDGRISEVGDETKCWYERGHLLKRITRIEQTQLYEFEVAEQNLAVGGRMRLSGGRYTLRELADGQTEVEV